MKTKPMVLIAFMGIILSSCIVKSIHPFYKEDNLYFDKNLLGTWMDKDSVNWSVKQIYVAYGEGSQRKEYRNNGYVVGNKTNSYDVFLFKINGQLYADFSASLAMTFTSNDAYTNDVITHNLAKVVLNHNEMTFIFFNADWLAGLIENNKVRISHEFVEYPKPVSQKFKGEYVLTASTDELQKFIAKYGDDPNAFNSNPSKRMEDGTYQWNAGDGEYTGKLTFDRDYKSSIKLKKVNGKN